MKTAALLAHSARVTLLAYGLWAISLPAFAQSPDQRIVELERRLERSMEIIDALSNRIKVLEQATPMRENATAQNTRIEAVEQQVSQMVFANSRRRGDDAGTPIHGFADVGIGLTDGGTRQGYTVGSLDFYLTPQLGERTKALLELVTEINEDGESVVDLERAQLGYTFSDAATGWLGRFHTPYGYYNAAFHHGQQIATSLRRPRFIDFEDKGGILPAHTVGLWLTGGTRAGGGKLTYDIWSGNSARLAMGALNPNAAGSTNHHLSTGANVGYRFYGSLDGLKLGAHWLTAQIDDDQIPSNRTALNVHGLYAVYDSDRWEHIAEIYRFRNNDTGGGTGLHTSTAGFAQFGMRLDRWTPYARYERSRLDQTDNYFAQQEFGASYHRGALGLRYDLDLKSALKFELAHTHIGDRSPGDYNEALFQFAIRF